MVASKKWMLKGATPRKSEKDYPGYLADQNRKPFEPTAREEEILCRTVHPEDLEKAIRRITALELKVDSLLSAKQTLEVRFNELCNMLSVQLANSGFKLLEIREAKE